MTSQAAPLSLVEFARQERRRDCPVCQLPPDIRAQMGVASNKGIRRAVVLAWLKDEHRLDLTNEALNTHYSGKHDG